MKNKLEDDIALAMAEEIQNEIDQLTLDDIMALGLEEKGWIKVPVRYSESAIEKAEWKINTSMWCHTNCQGDYKLLSHHWWFERAEDATAFILKWT